MSITNQNFDDKLHRITVKLYRNYLPRTKGKYVARTVNEDTLFIEDVASMMKTRGGFEGDYSVLVDYVKCFFREMAYELCDGYAVNTGYFSVYPSIGGTFNSAKDTFNPEKNKISFHYRTNAELRNLIKEIAVEVAGVSDANAFIHEFTDMEEESVNGVYSPNNVFSLSGRKIRVEGGDPACGVYFVPFDDPSKAVKVARIAENTHSRIIGISPDTGYANNRIEIRTQYTGCKKILLKEPRVIASDFTVEAV